MQKLSQKNLNLINLSQDAVGDFNKTLLEVLKSIGERVVNEARFITVENPYYRPLVHGDMPTLKVTQARFKEIENILRKKRPVNENQKSLINGLYEAIKNSIEWEIKDGQLILKSGLNYGKNIYQQPNSPTPCK